jgi:chitinase
MIRIPTMRFAFILLTVVAALCRPLEAQDRRHEVVGYYPSWKWRTDSRLLTPEKIPFGMLTIINYAFFYPLPDGSITGRDSTGDARILRGGSGTTGPGAPPSLTALAHRQGVRVLLSIGGWEDSGNFPAVAADSVRRGRFAQSCAGAIREFGFDGIDIDWEFPGFAEHNGTLSDGKNYVRLLGILRDTLNNLGNRSGRHLMLTAALPSDRNQALAMEIRDAAPLLDFLNIMTYDFYGPWDERAYHNAPLYAGPGGDSARTLDGAFRLYRETFAIPPEKINLGAPFYGHTYTACTELGGTHGPGDTVHFPAGGAFYYRIEAQKKNFTRHWDQQARVPWLTSSEWKILVSYDDEESTRAKARYVIDKGARGLIVWEITGDYLPDGSHPLLEAIDRVFHESH